MCVVALTGLLWLLLSWPVAALAVLAAALIVALLPLLSIGVDIGGTKVAAGVVDEGGAILERWQEPTPYTTS